MRRKTTWSPVPVAAAWPFAALLACGCLSMRSEHEVKPIHITMDVTVRMDRELDRYLGPVETEGTP